MTKWLFQKQICGLLTIKGDNIRINKLSIDTSDVEIYGKIDTLNYSNISDSSSKKNGGLLGKIFKQRYFEI